MSTKIEWAEDTWNPVTGCTKISPGCKHCYAERMAQRLGGRFGYPEDEPFRVTLHEDKMGEPLRWRKPRQVFVCSMGDLFHVSVPLEYVHRIFNVMESAHGHTFMILTKRPVRMREYMTTERYRVRGWMAPLPNVAIGVTVEDQKRANERIPILLDTPARWRFVSYEPALEAVDFNAAICRGCGNTGSAFYVGCDPGSGLDLCSACGGIGDNLDAIIAGCESGQRRRPASLDWFRSVRDQCQAAGVVFFLKQAEIDGELVKMPALDGVVHDALPWRSK